MNSTAADEQPARVRWRALGLGLALASLAAALSWHLSAAVRSPVLVATDGFTRLEPSLELPHFALTSGTGIEVSRESLKGRWTLVSLGFTSCPDICPNTLGMLARAIQELGAPSSEVRVLFLSVDPERDTPARLQSYVRFFGDSFDAATGPHAELQKLTKPLGLFYEREEAAAPSGSYSVAHSTALLVIDPSARVVGLIGGASLGLDSVSDALTSLRRAG